VDSGTPYSVRGGVILKKFYHEIKLDSDLVVFCTTPKVKQSLLSISKDIRIWDIIEGLKEEYPEFQKEDEDWVMPARLITSKFKYFIGSVP
jgi:hypothetical protein